jgi:nitrate/TMAO reductase-like tetraheme cytochrome c subunit
VKSKQKLFLIIGVAVLGLMVVGFVGMKETSKPEFCSSCHSMKPAYENWAASAHGQIDCMTCHSEPGFSGFMKMKLNGLKQVVVTLTSDVQPEDVIGLAHVDEAVCISCHNQEQTGKVQAHIIHANFVFGCLDCHNRVIHDPPEKASPDKTQEPCIACHRQ